MRRLTGSLVVAAIALLGLAPQASAATISNGTVTLGVNPAGSLNDQQAQIGVTYNATQNDGTIYGCPCEGWGAGAGGPTQFQARANEDAGNVGFRPVSFTTSATSAVSVVDILRAGTPALRLTQDFHPSPTSPNLYEITTTLENITGGSLSDVRYERVMDWDVEPTPTVEFVTINRGATPPGNLIYSDDNGFGDTFPFSERDPAGSNGPLDERNVNADYADKGPSDHGARFTFSLGALAPGESKQLFLYYGAAGNEPDANAAVSAAALEVFTYGQPSTPDGPDPDALPDGPAQGNPNTFIWGFRAVGGRPVFPPSLDLSPASSSGPVGQSHGLTATLRDSAGAPVPGAEIVFGVAGANPGGGAASTGADGAARFSYTGASAGGDTITACLDSNSNGACDAGEVADTATRSWDAPPPPQQQVAGTSDPGPVPVLGQTVVAGTVSGTVRVKGRDGRYRTLGANEAIPLGSTVDASKGKVRLTSAAGAGGATQSALFSQGAFKVTQTRGPKPVTQLALAGALRCGTAGRAQSSARRRVRRLWGDGRGRFRTRGRHGAATVRGTKWLTEDRCGGTLVRVRRGSVSVRDFAKRKTVTVKTGKSYLARAKRARRR